MTLVSGHLTGLRPVIGTFKRFSRAFNASFRAVVARPAGMDQTDGGNGPDGRNGLGGRKEWTGRTAGMGWADDRNGLGGRQEWVGRTAGMGRKNGGNGLSGRRKWAGAVRSQAGRRRADTLSCTGFYISEGNTWLEMHTSCFFGPKSQICPGKVFDIQSNEEKTR